MNALDWWGTYTGTSPCPDCNGIYTSLTLARNLTYTLRLHHARKSDEETVYRGTFTWNSGGNTVKLVDLPDGPEAFFVEENSVLQLDDRGRKMSADYRLTRTPASRLSGLRWNLENLMGKHLRINPAYMIFDSDRGLVTGYAWCNSFQTTFEMSSDSTIRFAPVIVGNTTCKDTTLETQFMNMFAAVEGFEQSAHSLMLYRTRTTPLAIFNQAQVRGIPPQ
jgi:heat shock protein HslJ